MQLILEQVEKLKAALVASGSAIKQSIALHLTQGQKIAEQAAELASLKGEELAEDAQQAAEQAAVLESLRACTSALTEMGETVVAATAPEPTPVTASATPETIPAPQPTPVTEQTPVV